MRAGLQLDGHAGQRPGRGAERLPDGLVDHPWQVQGGRRQHHLPHGHAGRVLDRPGSVRSAHGLVPTAAAGCRVQGVDLLDAAPGALCAYRVIAEPRREHFFGEVEWRVAQANAHATRRLLASSVLRSVLPRQMQDHVLTEVALMRAVGEVSAATTSSLSDVVTALGRVDGDPELQRHAGYMHDFLAEAARTSHGRLLFPPGYRNDYNGEESLLTVYSLRGLTFPDDKAKGSEDLDERLSMCVLYLAAWLAQRAMYLGDRHARKGIFIDEAWALSTFTTGRRYIERAGRDSRKHNTRVLMASQNPSDLLRLDLASSPPVHEQWHGQAHSLNGHLEVDVHPKFWPVKSERWFLNLWMRDPNGRPDWDLVDTRSLL